MPILEKLAETQADYKINLNTGNYSVNTTPVEQETELRNPDVFFLDHKEGNLKSQIVEHINYFGIEENDLNF